MRGVRSLENNIDKPIKYNEAYPNRLPFQFFNPRFTFRDAFSTRKRTIKDPQSEFEIALPEVSIVNHTREKCTFSIFIQKIYCI